MKIELERGFGIFPSFSIFVGFQKAEQISYFSKRKAIENE